MCKRFMVAVVPTRPSRLARRLRRLTQMHSKGNICVHLRNLREIFSGISARDGLQGRYDLPAGGIGHRLIAEIPNSKFKNPKSAIRNPKFLIPDS